jgi:hypothetical protein
MVRHTLTPFSNFLAIDGVNSRMIALLIPVFMRYNGQGPHS